MSGWRRVLALVLVVLAALAGTRVDLCLCADPAPASCCEPTTPADACCCCCAPVTPPQAVGAPACDCPALDLSGSTPEPASAAASAAADDRRAGPVPGVDLVLDLAAAPRVTSLAARAGPTTRPPPGPLRPHLANRSLRC